MLASITDQYAPVPNRIRSKLTKKRKKERGRERERRGKEKEANGDAGGGHQKTMEALRGPLRTSRLRPPPIEENRER